MAYQNVGTPRFFINEALYHQTAGNYINSVLELNPSDINTYAAEAIALSLDAAPTYIVTLGQSAGLIITTDEDVELGSNFGINTDLSEAGFSLLEYPGASAELGVTITGDLGALCIGRYFDMPHSADLSLKMSHEYKGIKRQESMGGSTLTNMNYYKPPKWGSLEAWQLGSFPRRYSGRRIWNLTFSFLSDENIEPKFYDINENATQTTWKDNWFTNVLHYTMGGALPFIFQPDKDISYSTASGEITSIPELAICRFDMNTYSRKQVAHNMYTISVKIKESW